MSKDKNKEENIYALDLEFDNNTETKTQESKKRGRPKKIEANEMHEKTNKIIEQQNEIKMHTENNITVVDLKYNSYKLELLKNEYNVYTEKDEKSYIIIRDQNIRLVSDGRYLLIQRDGEEYIITTNQNFAINYLIENLERKDNIVKFRTKNLIQIESAKEGLTFEINEQKIIEKNLEDNKTLIISEEDGKVYLPYTKEQIKDELEQDNNAKISEVIEKKYIIPLDKYKNSMKARFIEAYKLMYKKEGKSKRSAILLGFELMFERNLHPAIISACKNVEELDIYLDCLEDNELEKFSCFKIIYKSLPMLRKSKKTEEF